MSDYGSLHRKLGQSFADTFLQLANANATNNDILGVNFNNILNALDLAFTDNEYAFTVPAHAVVAELFPYLYVTETFQTGTVYTERAIQAAEVRQDERNLGNLLAQQAVFLGSQGTFEQVIPLLTRSLNIAHKTDDRKLACRVTMNLGTAFMLQSQLELARQYSEEALVLARQLGDDSQIANLLPNLANIALMQADYASSLVYLTEAEILRRSDNEILQGAIDINRGIALGRMGQRKQAEVLLSDRLKFASESGPATDALISLNSLAEMAILYADRSAARQFLERTEPYKNAVALAEYVGMTYCLWGILLGHEEGLSAAQPYWDLARHSANEQGNRNIQSMVALAEGQLLASLGHYDMARQSLESALEVAKSADIFELEGRAALTLSQIPSYPQQAAMRRRAAEIFSQPSIFASQL